jgi:hypothetical protein
MEVGLSKIQIFPHRLNFVVKYEVSICPAKLENYTTLLYMYVNVIHHKAYFPIFFVFKMFVLCVKFRTVFCRLKHFMKVR